MAAVCGSCGQVKDVPAYDAQLWELYHRLDDGGRKHIEPLVYTADDLENAWDPDDGYDAVKASMERNMAERGLCPDCGRPNLAGKTEDDFLSEEDADDLSEMYAEMAAERRMGA